MAKIMAHFVLQELEWNGTGNYATLTIYMYWVSQLEEKCSLYTGSLFDSVKPFYTGYGFNSIL